MILALASERDPEDPDVRVYSPNAIAEAIGVSRPTVQEVEQDHKCKRRTGYVEHEPGLVGDAFGALELWARP
jgi:hypothetical protein